MEMEDDAFFAELSKRIALLIVEEEEEIIQVKTLSLSLSLLLLVLKKIEELQN